MDDWLRFQYYVATEMWGRRGAARAGDGEAGISAAAGGQEKPFTKGRA